MSHPQSITSTKNPRVKAAAKLRERDGRREQGRIIIDGGRELARALDAEMRFKEYYVCDELCADEDSRSLMTRLAETGAERLDATRPVYEQLAYGSVRSGIVAVAEAPHRELTDLKLAAHALVAVIEGVEKPGNIGAVLRSADGAGVDAVIVADPRTDLFNPNVIRASLGTVFTSTVRVASPADALEWLRANQFRMFAARVDAEMNYVSAPLSGGVALILGSEAEGLSDVWRAPDVTPIRLPMHGAADSLNLSAAAAVLFYEALRQRAG